MKFKKALFGFKRRQVLAYVDQTCMEYEQKLQAQAQAHEKYRELTEKNLQELAASLENSRIVCAEQTKQLEDRETELLQKDQQLAEAANLSDTLMNRLQEVGVQVTALTQALGEKEELLLGKDSIIASQKAQVAGLQEQVSRFEAEFSQLRGQAEQSTALVNCLNVLHERNRGLIAQIALLETRLEEVTNGTLVKEHAQAVTQNKQMIHSTEQLFAALRKEIGDALDSISSKIESGGIAESEDGKFFVDMANL